MAEGLRVLLVSLFHPELLRGGAQQICYELFEGLKETPGVQPTLLASVDGALYPALFKSGACITGFDDRDGEFLFLMRDYDYWWHKTSQPAMVEAFAEFARCAGRRRRLPDLPGGIRHAGQQHPRRRARPPRAAPRAGRRGHRGQPG